MPLPEEHVLKVCNIGNGEATCSYVMFGPEGWVCAKNTNMRPVIEARRDTMRAKGDNCDGPPTFTRQKWMVEKEYYRHISNCEGCRNRPLSAMCVEGVRIHTELESHLSRSNPSLDLDAIEKTARMALDGEAQPSISPSTVLALVTQLRKIATENQRFLKDKIRMDRIEWADAVLKCHEDEDDPNRRFSFRDMATPPTPENPDGTIWGPTARGVLDIAMTGNPTDA